MDYIWPELKTHYYIYTIFVSVVLILVWISKHILIYSEDNIWLHCLSFAWNCRWKKGASQAYNMHGFWCRRWHFVYFQMHSVWIMFLLFGRVSMFLKLFLILTHIISNISMCLFYYHEFLSNIYILYIYNKYILIDWSQHYKS